MYEYDELAIRTRRVPAKYFAQWSCHAVRRVHRVRCVWRSFPRTNHKRISMYREIEMQQGQREGGSDAAIYHLPMNLDVPWEVLWLQ